MIGNDERDGALPWHLMLWRLLERALSVYERAPGAFVGVTALAYLPALVLELANPPLQSWVLTLLYFVFSIGSLIVSSAGATELVARVRRGERPAAGDAIRAVMGSAAPLAVTCLVTGAVTAAGICLVIPGLVMVVLSTFAGPAVTQEGLQGWEAVRRGRALLADGRWLQVVGVLLTAAGTRLVLGMLPTLGLKVYLMFSHQMTPLLSGVITLYDAALDIALMSVIASWIGCAWFDLIEAVKAE